MTLNLYADPALAATYTAFGSGIAHTGNTLAFNDATNLDAQSIVAGNAILPDLFDRIAAGGKYYISVNVANYDHGGGRAKLCAGSYVNLGIAGNGWTTPVAITAGTSRTWGIGFYGISAGGTFDIIPDANNEAVRITT